jgi:polyisoprenyl-teichoic acid--peptidoglycan teichoic acid transferase
MFLCRIDWKEGLDMLKLKNLKGKKKVILIGSSVVLFIATLLLGVYLFAQYRYNKDIRSDGWGNIYFPGAYEPVYNPEPREEYEIESNIVNVLLVGVDTRGDFRDSRTDSIIIATIDPDNKTVKLTSLMRDMYVEIPKRGYQRINVAFTLGGIDLLKKTIKHNFGLNIEYYAAIDFSGFQELIDIVGGVDLEVKRYEVNEINKYIKEVNGANSTLLSGEGIQKLNGQQALSYCRIRSVGNSDYERTERQRKVLSLLLGKVQESKITDFPKLYSAISPFIKTNVPFNTTLKLGYTVYRFENFTPESMRLPIDGHFKSTYIRGMAVLVPELNYSARALHKFIYNTVPEKLVVADNSKIYNMKPEPTPTAGNDGQEPEPPIDPHPIESPKPKPTEEPTQTPEPTQKPVASPTPKPTAVPAPTPTPTPTTAPTTAPTQAPTPSPTPTPTPAPASTDAPPA